MAQPEVRIHQAAARIAQAPQQVQQVPGTRLRLFHVWKAQVGSVASTEGQPSSARLDRFVADSYRPFPALWSWLCPNEQHYRVWSDQLIAQIAADAHGCLRLAIDTDFGGLFRTACARLERVTGRQAEGDWYLAYAAAGDLGGNGGTMHANLARLAERGIGHLRLMLPHELNHQIYHRAHPETPLSLVRTIVEEGLCCFANRLCWRGHGSPALHADFAFGDWDWAVTHERQVIDAVLPQFDSTAWEHIKPYHQWHVYPWEGAADRLAYFLGFRLCEAYVRRFGQGSLADLYELEPMDAWTRSRYAAKA